MELDWCSCGKQVFDQSSLYCSNECAKADNSTLKLNKNANLQHPPSNLHFSITITPNRYKASDSNRIISVPSSISSSFDSNVSSSFTSVCTLDNNFNENYSYVYTRNHHRYHDDNDDSTLYLSSSNPIDIPSPRTKAASDPALEQPNKGTFGNETSFF